MATYWENSCSFGLRYVSWYKYLIVSLVFSHLGFWSGNLFLIAPFPDLCLLVPFSFHVWAVIMSGTYMLRATRARFTSMRWIQRVCYVAKNQKVLTIVCLHVSH